MVQIHSLKTETKFKKTEIGEIPVDWRIEKLKSIAKIIMGQSPSSSNCSDYENGLPFFQGKAEFGYKYPKIVKWCISPKKTAERGDILISVRAPVGDLNIAPEKSCIGRGLAAIRGIKSNNDYLYFVLDYFKDKLKKIGQGSTFEAINKNDLYELTIPLASLPEQKKIAEILSTIDEAIEKKKEVIEKTKELKKGLMQELLTRGIGHSKFRKTEIGDIPVDWKVLTLQEISDEVYRYPTYYNIEYSDAGIPEIRGELIKANGTLERDFSKYRFISYETASKFPRTSLKEGDFVISVRGTMGKVAIVPKLLEGANITANLIRISPDRKNIFPLFFHQLLVSDKFQEKLDNVSSSTTIKTIKAPELKRFKFPIPPLQEQKRIAEILSNLDEAIEMDIVKQKRLEEIKKGLMQALLTGKVRVGTKDLMSK